MNVGAAIFGVFCLVAVIAGVIYVASVNSQQSPVTDTYGNTLSQGSNTSQNVVSTVTSTSESNVWPLVLIAIVVIIFIVLFALYIASKTLL